MSQTREQDIKLNKMALEMAVYGAVGYAVGTGLSVLFKGKAKIRHMAGGAGVGVAFSKNEGGQQFYLGHYDLKH